MKWRSRRITESKQPSQELLESQARLRASERSLRDVQVNIIEPLRRTRREMLTENHVAEALVRRVEMRIRGGGGVGSGA